MADMSKAIRTQLQLHGQKISDIPTPVLRELAQVITAYALDLQDELKRRREDA